MLALAPFNIRQELRYENVQETSRNLYPNGKVRVSPIHARQARVLRSNRTSLQFREKKERGGLRCENNPMR